jgi:hypothetical protein
MPLYKFDVEERNGEQEYTIPEYIIAKDFQTAEAHALEWIKDWYDNAEPSDYYPGAYEIDGGAVIWELGSVEEISEFVIFDVESRKDVHIPVVLPPADPEVRSYIDEGGSRCLKCHDNDIDGWHVEVDAGGAWQHIVCNNCGAEWNDIYELVDVEVEVLTVEGGF